MLGASYEERNSNWREMIIVVQPSIARNMGFFKKPLSKLAECSLTNS
jgi:hypothetical protein